MHQIILDQLNEAILLFDKELKLTYINTSGEMLFSDSARHLLGKNAASLFRSSDPAILQDLQQCLTVQNALLDRGVQLELPDRTIAINICVTPLFEKQILSQILMELQPVDRHLQISREEQLLTQQNIARTLVRGMAHEIKNPLGGLRGAAQLLEAELENPELKEYTQIIISESDRLQGLMDQMLGPNTPPKKSHINIHEILERVRQLVQAGITNKIQIHRDYDPSIPMIKADKDQLIQSLLNIVSNAVQALGSEGVINIKSRIVRQMTIGRKCYKLVSKIEIQDNGPGIKPEIMNQIFYPMITDRPEGTGLGLSIAQSLINQHNGLIECSSAPGNTVFSIYLPVE